ncbi:MAG: phosphoserine transaminase [Rhizobiales bacterium]|nr:phosphoserine transaminase [Hyphomicrobiales bacterium]MBI3673670.1 phosphoserine transaminase [Hyphomicrobiales bacterium]
MTIAKPAVRPAIPHFSSGPCAKIPGWSPKLLDRALTGRSHRSAEGKARLKRAIQLTREVLEVPPDYRIGIVPASDTGAVEMALWSLLGPRGVDLLAWESFGEGWVGDVVKQLKLKDARSLTAPYGELPDLSQVDFTRDVVFAWNGTTSGVRVADAAWIPAARDGLTICDATSAAFAQRLDFAKLDVVTFSWQKVLGGEGAHGVIILSPRAVTRLETYTPPWPMPKIFRLTSGGKLSAGIFEGETINTPSMLCVEDYIVALEWARGIGGPKALRSRADANAAAIEAWLARTPWAQNLAKVPATRSNTSVCLTLTADASVPKKMAKLLEAEGVAFDIGAYRDAPPGLRIWCGATVETADIEALLPWLDWAYAQAIS